MDNTTCNNDNDNVQIGKKIEELKAKRATYYRERYNKDDQYREWRKRYSLSRYTRKTIQCTHCKRRFKYEELQKTNYEYDDYNFNCFDCKFPELSFQNLKLKRPKLDNNVLEYNGEEC